MGDIILDQPRAKAAVSGAENAEAGAHDRGRRNRPDRRRTANGGRHSNRDASQRGVRRQDGVYLPGADKHRDRIHRVRSLRDLHRNAAQRGREREGERGTGAGAKVHTEDREKRTLGDRPTGQTGRHEAGAVDDAAGSNQLSETDGRGGENKQSYDGWPKRIGTH